jgi:hypothetical protein
MSGGTDEQDGSFLFGDTTFAFQADRKGFYMFRLLNRLEANLRYAIVRFFERFHFLAAISVRTDRVYFAISDFAAGRWLLSQFRTLRRPSSKIRS